MCIHQTLYTFRHLVPTYFTLTYFQGNFDSAATTLILDNIFNVEASNKIELFLRGIRKKWFSLYFTATLPSCKITLFIFIPYMQF